MTKQMLFLKKISKELWMKGIFRKRTSCLPKWWTSKSKYVTGAFAEYDLSKVNSRLQLFVLFQSKVLFVKSFGFIKTKQMICLF